MTGDMWLDGILWCVIFPSVAILAVGAALELWERRR